jgi:hypothetical protein
MEKYIIRLNKLNKLIEMYYTDNETEHLNDVTKSINIIIGDLN